MILDVTDENFEQEVLKSEVPVLIDFWAEWCGPCQTLAPILKEVDEELNGQVKIVKLNVDNNPLTPSKHGIRGIPTIMLFKNGQQVGVKVGALPKATIIEWLKSS